MQDFPTPASVGYVSEFDKIIDIIRTNLSERLFEFEVSEKMNSYFERVQEYVKEFGWSVRSVFRDVYDIKNESRKVIYWEFYSMENSL